MPRLLVSRGIHFLEGGYGYSCYGPDTRLGHAAVINVLPVSKVVALNEQPDTLFLPLQSGIGKQIGLVVIDQSVCPGI